MNETSPENAPVTETSTSVETPPSPADASRSKIKIGTQRPGIAAPRAEPRVQFVVEGAQPKPQPQQPEQPPEEAARTVDQPSPQQPPSPVAPASVAAPAILPDEPDLPAVVRRPTKPADDLPRPGEIVPRPSTRGALSAELQQELDAALGDMSLDEMIASESTGKRAVQFEENEKCRGRVMRLSRDMVFVELGSRHQGAVPLRQFTEAPVVGKELEVVVTRFNAEDGLYELSLTGSAARVEDWSQVSEGLLVEAVITGHNKGGLECDVNKLRGFIPISQVSLYRVEDLSPFVGQRLQCLITEANPDKRNLVLSHRAVLERSQQEAREKIFHDLQVGQIREGVVRNLRDFGAFVDLGGIDGMIHVGQMSWDRIKHPSEVLEVGQKVRVKIEKIDPDTRKIGLSYRELTENPWRSAATKYTGGGVVRGRVTRIMEFGAFVKLEPGIEGLVHISEIAHGRVFRVSDFLAEGQEVEAKVLSVDSDNQRISLSIKALMARPMPIKKEEPDLPPEPEPPPAPISKKPAAPLKGGIGRKTGGEEFGLKW